MEASMRSRGATADEAAHWLVAMRSGDLDPGGREAFVGWLRASPVHVEEYLAICGIHADLPAAAARSSHSRESLRAAAREAMDIPSISRPAREKRRTRWGRLAIAATVLMTVCSAAWVAMNARGQAFVTRHGEQLNWQLSDMSVVRLNSDSAIRVRFDGKRREVVLVRGQAYFEVARDPSRPFSVRTPSSIFTALGTRFDVYQRPMETLLTVTEGRVGIASAGSPSSPALELHAGDQARVRNSGAVSGVERIDTLRATAWMRQEIAFDREAVVDVVAEFNRYNRIQLVVDDPRVAQIPVSGVFRIYDVRSFIEFLQQLPGVTVDTVDDRATVTHVPE